MVRDWVVTTDLWQSTDGAGQLPPGPGGLLQMGELLEIPLTASRENPSIAQYSVPEITTRMMAVEVRGYLHFHLATPVGVNLAQAFADNWRGLCTTRISRYPQEANGRIIAPIADYDCQTVPAANDQYVWQHEELLVNLASSEWLGTAGARAPLSWTVPVRVRFKRILEELECMAFFLQWQQWVAPADATWANVEDTVFLRWRSSLRTFVHAFT